MSSALPIITSRECLRALLKAGFYIDHQTGAHARLFHQTRRELRVTIPIHAKDLPRATLKAILAQAQLTVEEFRAFL